MIKKRIQIKDCRSQKRIAHLPSNALKISRANVTFPFDPLVLLLKQHVAPELKLEEDNFETQENKTIIEQIQD